MIINRYDITRYNQTGIKIPLPKKHGRIQQDRPKSKNPIYSRFLRRLVSTMQDANPNNNKTGRREQGKVDFDQSGC